MLSVPDIEITHIAPISGVSVYLCVLVAMHLCTVSVGGLDGRLLAAAAAAAAQKRTHADP